MLTELSVSNFKSWERIDRMELASISGLFGTNSSGKTSVLQLLLMLKQTVESSDRALVLNLGAERVQTPLGSYRDVVYQHDVARAISWQIGWKAMRPLNVVSPERPTEVLFAGRDLQFGGQVSQTDDGSIVVDNFTYGLNGQRFTMRRKARTSRYELKAEPGPFRFIRQKGRAWDLPVPVKSYGFPDQVKAYFQNAGFLGDLQLAFEDLFAQLYYLGPLREYPHREYIWSGAQPEDVGSRGERVVDALLAARARGQKISRGKGRKAHTLEEHVAGWLRSLGLINSFRVESLTPGSNLYQVKVRRTEDSPEVLVTDVGFGVSQVLPVLVLCSYVPPGSIIVLEQPEIHLHPAVQAGLADVLIEAARERNVQIIVESHSEFLLQRLQRRIAEQVVTPAETALFFCETIQGRSELTRLEVDVFGNITNWPADFFGDSLGELTAMAEAVANRRGAADARPGH